MTKLIYELKLRPNIHELSYQVEFGFQPRYGNRPDSDFRIPSSNHVMENGIKSSNWKTECNGGPSMIGLTTNWIGGSHSESTFDGRTDFRPKSKSRNHTVADFDRSRKSEIIRGPKSTKSPDFLEYTGWLRNTTPPPGQKCWTRRETKKYEQRT